MFLTLCCLTHEESLFGMNLKNLNRLDVKITSLYIHEAYTCKYMKINIEGYELDLRGMCWSSYLWV